MSRANTESEFLLLHWLTVQITVQLLVGLDRKLGELMISNMHVVRIHRILKLFVDIGQLYAAI